MKEYTRISEKAITNVKENLWNLDLSKYENTPVTMEKLNEYLLNELRLHWRKV